MSATDFFDSNVVLYLVSSETAKAERSEELVLRGGTVSVQVLNECIAVCRRKYRSDWGKVDALLAAVRATCTIVDLTLPSHDLARRLAERYGFQIYDANIVAAALLADCTVLYSEDMQDGMIIDGLTIRNPYAALARGDRPS